MEDYSDRSRGQPSNRAGRSALQCVGRSLAKPDWAQWPNKTTLKGKGRIRALQ